MSKLNARIQMYSRRVDAQVSVLSAGMVVCACLFLAIFFYSYTYNTMITSLKDRTESVSIFLEQTVVVDSFLDINEREDENKESYKELKRILEEIRLITNLRYLYTAKLDSTGNYIYLVDGLAEDSPDFRYPGDLIEEETIPDLEKANNGEIVRPNRILNTSWGQIFLAYYPIHHPDTGEVIGVLGMEFEASQEYRAYRNVLWLTALVIVVICILSFLLASKMFKRLSNPRIQDLYNTDQLTQLKSRNAFEFDMKNIQVSNRKEGLGIIIMDLDHLKEINDRYGHAMGDKYIHTTAEVIRNLLHENAWAYRIGGDEFAVFMAQTNMDAMQAWVADFEAKFEQKVKVDLPRAAVSVGMAIHTGEEDLTMHDLYKQADKSMYQDKINNRR